MCNRLQLLTHTVYALIQVVSPAASYVSSKWSNVHACCPNGMLKMNINGRHMVGRLNPFPTACAHGTTLVLPADIEASGPSLRVSHDHRSFVCRKRPQIAMQLNVVYALVCVEWEVSLVVVEHIQLCGTCICCTMVRHVEVTGGQCGQFPPE